ncbi:unnamed protein product [Closterium sp. NIES-53]
MEVARTSMIHAAATHFLWPFVVRYAAHQLKLWPRTSLPETSPTLHWTGKVGDASVFQVWGSRAFVSDTSADKLSSRAIPCVFLGFPLNPSGWQFYHPTSRRVPPSLDITFDEVLLPQVDPLPLAEPVVVSVDSGAAGGDAARGAAFGGGEPTSAEPGGAKPGSAEPRGAKREGAEPGGADSKSAKLGGAEPEGTESGLRNWFPRRTRLRSGTAGAGGPAAGGTRGGGAGATSVRI